MIDLDHLARQTAGDTALQQELLSLFRSQIEDVLRLTENARQTDPVALMDVVHRLRGAALAVGARSLAATLSHSEAALGDATSSAADAIDALRSALRDAHSDVSRLLPR